MKKLGQMHIYKPSYGDCSNKGISSKYDEVIIVDEMDPDAPENAVVIIEDVIMGQDRIRAIPANRDGWSMFGGCFVYTCNGVVPHHGIAIALHDRFETPEEYEMYSR